MLKALAKLRNQLWNYPDDLFFNPDSVSATVARAYKLSRPLSHFIFAGVLTVFIFLYAFGAYRALAGGRGSVLIEGVVVGIDAQGRIQIPSKISPLLPSAIQIEKDISELIYEPLIRYKGEGEIELVLAGDITRIQEGADYEFTVREGVQWHDGTRFTIDDVIRSLEIVSQLDDTNTNSYVQAIKQMAWEKTGENTIRICTVANRAVISDMTNKCSGVSGDKPILANFLELISIKIIPTHLAADINARTISQPDPILNRFPVGTGKYKFGGITGNVISLDMNTNYYQTKPQIKQIKFKLYKTDREAVAAIQNGEVHTFSTASTEFLAEIRDYEQIKPVLSPVLGNQYWAIYFNLRKNPDGSPLGPSFFQDVNVRKAISHAINRTDVLEVLSGVGEEALGPIAKASYFYNEKATWSTYNQAEAERLLAEAGWTRRGDQTLTKDGVKLSFNLSFVDSPDRKRVVESIRRNLEDIGIELIPAPRVLSELTTEVLTPKQFDALLYGMNTFIDPDRYELFHSSEAVRLNLSGYVGSDETVKIEGGTTVRLPRVDRLLEQGRSFDPLVAKANRKEAYDRFQELLAADSPMAFLYNPQFIYLTNSRVENVDLSNVGGIEQRFRNIDSWWVAY